MRKTILSFVLVFGMAGAAQASDFVVVGSTDPAVKRGTELDAANLREELQRMKLGLASRTLGHAMPTAALCYVWDNRHPVGTIVPNIYFSQVRTIVLQSGDANAGTWQSQRRNLAADFRAAFGRAAPQVTGIALASDTDNPGGHAQAWFGALTLTADAPTSTAREPL